MYTIINARFNFSVGDFLSSNQLPYLMKFLRTSNIYKANFSANFDWHLITKFKSHYEEMIFKGTCLCTMISSPFLRYHDLKKNSQSSGLSCKKWTMVHHWVLQNYQKPFNSKSKAASTGNICKYGKCSIGDIHDH